MTVTWTHDPPRTELPENFLYVGQDNYYLGPRDSEWPRCIYSDSATSCIILTLEGYGRDKQPLIAFTHLSCAERFWAFFDIADQHFQGPAALFALGANPPTADSSKRNRHILIDWIHRHQPPLHAGTLRTKTWYLDQAALALGFRVPEKERSGCAGIDVHTGIVSTQAYALTEEQHDLTGGVQTLFSIFGLTLDPPLMLHDATKEFCSEHIEQLVQVAKDAHWERIIQMNTRQLLHLFSSTPDDELPWFSNTLRTSAEYVMRHASCVKKRRHPS